MPHHERDEWSRWRHVADPADAIAAIDAASTHPPDSRSYQRLMAVIDADLFTRPDYGDLLTLGHTITARHTRATEEW